MMPKIFRLGLLMLLLAWPAAAFAVPARERAIEQIPELMGRILESQEEIREREIEMTPVVEKYDGQLVAAKQGIEAAASEAEAAEALVDYVEAYASRLEAQDAGLRSIESAVVRMRADARDLMRAAELAGRAEETPAERQTFYQGHFQGVAAGTAELATRLEREEEAATAGAVLHASWASHGALDIPLPELGPDGAIAFARKVEGLYARYQARSNQLRAERGAVRRLLDLLIERQLAQRLDSLFSGENAIGLGALLSGEGKSQDWQDLGNVVSRALGLPSGGDYRVVRNTMSLDRLDYFARGRYEPRDWKTEVVRRYLHGAPQREVDDAIFEMLQREAYLTSCDVSVAAARGELVGWRLVGRMPEEYGSAVLESVLERAGFDLGLRSLFDGDQSAMTAAARSPGPPKLRRGSRYGAR
jgi:hypothetical protein